LAAYFFVQCLWGYVSAIRPRDGSAFYPCFLEEGRIPQGLKNRSSSNVLREVHVAALAVVKDDLIHEAALVSYVYNIVHIPLLSVLQKAKVSSSVEDDVVQQLDADDFTRRFELGGDVDVALRRFNTSAGVIVGNDDSRGPVGQRIREDFARMNRAPVNQV